MRDDGTAGKDAEISAEVLLTGGFQTPGVVRVGATVRRPTGKHSPFVHELLRFLEATGFEGAPRLLGIDERGREILTFLAGDVIHDVGAHPLTDVELAQAATLIRRFHDVTMGSRLAAGAEIVCHNELGPHNTVFVNGRPVAFIDWDDAAPGTRLRDFANAIWCFVNVGASGGPIADQARRIQVMCDGYGWADPGAIVDEIHADLCRALAKHERAGRREPTRIFGELVHWMVVHGSQLKGLGDCGSATGR